MDPEWFIYTDTSVDVFLSSLIYGDWLRIRILVKPVNSETSSSPNQYVGASIQILDMKNPEHSSPGFRFTARIKVLDRIMETTGIVYSGTWTCQINLPADFLADAPVMS